MSKQVRGISPSIKRWDAANTVQAIQSDTASLLNQVRGKSGISESHITDTHSPVVNEVEGREKETPKLIVGGCSCWTCKASRRLRV